MGTPRDSPAAESVAYSTAPGHWSRVGRALFILALLELGLLLLVLPWTSLWQHNYLLQHWTWLGQWPLSSYARGAVSGWGLINLWLGTGEIVRTHS
ncbi:MAG: hypothetical protein ACRD2F_16480 [Terriglobales bacterium]